LLGTNKQTNKQKGIPPNRDFQLVPRNRIHTDKLIVAYIYKKFSAFCGTFRFITVFTRSRHWSLSWCRWIQS